jgi:antitoxin PrlF
MATRTLTSKGQITIPKEIRDRLRLRAGERLEFQIASEGYIVVRPKRIDARRLKGILSRPAKRPVSIEEMNRAIAEGFGHL